MNSSQQETLQITESVLKTVIYAMALHADIDLIELGRLFKSPHILGRLHPSAAEMLDHIGDTLISSTGLPPLEATD
jgi:hypothetical protein